MEGLTVTLFDLTGRKAFVTGASRGIGQVIAVALAEAGADLALVARSEEGLAATAISCPMPRDAPVTNAFLPVKSKRLTVSPSTRWAAAMRAG